MILRLAQAFMARAGNDLVRPSASANHLFGYRLDVFRKRCFFFFSLLGSVLIERKTRAELVDDGKRPER